MATRALSDLVSSTGAAAAADGVLSEVQLLNLQQRVAALQQQCKGLSGDDVQQALAGGCRAACVEGIFCIPQQVSEVQVIVHDLGR